MLNFKPTFSLSTFTFIKRLFSSSSLSAIRVVSSAYLRLLIFLQFSCIQIPKWFICQSSNLDSSLCFLQPSLSHAYVRSFLYLLYTLIKLYYTKALSDQASSLALDWILLLQGPRILASLRDSKTTFQWDIFFSNDHCKIKTLRLRLGVESSTNNKGRKKGSTEFLKCT